MHKQFYNIESKLNNMIDREKDFAQKRSNFQIEKFIGCSEYTPITQFRLLSHNAYVILQEVRKEMINMERKERKLSCFHKPNANENENVDLDILDIELEIENSEIRIRGLLKEIDFFEKCCNELEKRNKKPFTPEQLQLEEPTYWQKRIETQIRQTQMGQQTGMGEGNLNSLEQALALPITENSINIIENNYIKKEQIE